ncbi:MAG: isochorismatase family protein [Pseudomonadota bacterium]
MDVILVVDMQVGLREGAPKHELARVIARINALTDHVRKAAGQVIWIRHCGGPGDHFEPGTAGWEFLPELCHDDADRIVEKTLNDPFAGTGLNDELRTSNPERVIICGWATDFCVDATVRSCVSNNYHVVVANDAHTLNDRPNLTAAAVIDYHNWLWTELLTHRSIRVMPTADIISEAMLEPGLS